MFYYLCKSPRCYAKLIAEVDDMDKKGDLSNPITFGEASRMPYLQACMKEAMRIHPAVGQMLERVVQYLQVVRNLAIYSCLQVQ
jgi:cytochrome P450